MTDYGLLVLVAACRVWAVPGGKCPPDLLLRKVNRWLDESHKIGQVELNTICLELDKQTGSRVVAPGSDDEKQRDDGIFEEAVKEAFNSFRKQERDILLNVPGDSRPKMGHEGVDSSILAHRNEKWWWAAAHMRHYLELLLVLKGLKPCVLFVRHTIDNCAIFSTIVLDSLVPIMNRLGLWSYGFRLGFRHGEWVLYDARSPNRSQVEKIFLTPNFVREMDQTGAFPAKDNMYYVPDLEVAHALGYPILSDAIPADGEASWIHIRDVTEMNELVRLGRPEPLCCVQGMIYCCPAGEGAGEADWKEVLKHFFRCETVADDMGTQLGLWTRRHEAMNTWLKRNPGWLCGRSSGIAFSGPRLFSLMGVSCEFDDLDFEDDDLDSEDDDLEDDEEDSEDEYPDVEDYDLD